MKNKLVFLVVAMITVNHIAFPMIQCNMVSAAVKSVEESQAITSSSVNEIFSKAKVDRLISKVKKNTVIYQDKTTVDGRKLVRNMMNTKKINASIFASKDTNTQSRPTRKGVIIVTSDAFKGLIPTGHAAIVYSSSKVVESVAEGVVIGNNNWDDTRDEYYGVTTYNTTAAQDSAVADYCYSMIGKPYNWNYFNTSTRSKFYCSQLVYAAYLEKENIDLNTSEFNIPGVGNPIHPMEIVSSPNTYTVYHHEK